MVTCLEQEQEQKTRTTISSIVTNHSSTVTFLEQEQKQHFFSVVTNHSSTVTCLEQELKTKDKLKNVNKPKTLKFQP
jgi:hypothetical protein